VEYGDMTERGLRRGLIPSQKWFQNDVIIKIKGLMEIKNPDQRSRRGSEIRSMVKIHVWDSWNEVKM